MSAVVQSISLSSPIESLPGITPRRAKLLYQLGLRNLIDLVEHFPRTYQFEAAESDVAGLRDGTVHTVRGTIVACDYIVGRGKPRFEATLEDTTGQKLSLVWFNAGYYRRSITPGTFLRVRGRVRQFRGMPQMTNPGTQKIGEDAPWIEESKVRPIYAATAELESREIEKIVEQQIPLAAPMMGEFWDEALRKRRGLIPRDEAYRLIHLPQSKRDAERARRRLVYDELMLLQLGLAIGKRVGAGGSKSGATAPVFRVDKTLDQRIRARFPFDLTSAQIRATHDILRDTQSGRPMHRLLQGDVGSGKTSVAVYGMLTAVANKMQAALLAPTEVLAEQHYMTLSNLLAGSKVEVSLFTQRTKRQTRKANTRDLAEGRTHIAVGTQALIQEDIDFANLGIVVVDEQHRFGVRQRAMLKTKGLAPHYLVMTATPIPRTLALSFFADFDVSVIDELPPGRTPIKTSFFRTEQSAPAWQFVRREIAAGRQAFVVLPQIDETAGEDIKSVRKEFERLSKTELSGARLLMLHGQMPTDEKQQIMEGFRRGEADVLVATTVIEVGIDVPNATVMVIESAERFGIAQLHQLRGRVGRGGHASYCILVSDARTDDAIDRLQALCRTNDGFEIAELDLRIRGPGDFFGVRQSGLPQLKLADITQELQLLQVCRDDAAEILQHDPMLRDASHRALKAALIDRFGNTLGFAQIG
jgi:ATP-dependent DNA helicase RecG